MPTGRSFNSGTRRNSKKMHGAAKSGSYRKLPLPRRRGLSFVELLVVLLLSSVLFGGIALSFSSFTGSQPSPQDVRREGKFAAQWLQRIFYKALLSGRSFAFRISPSVPQRYLKINWSNPSEVEIYDGKEQAWFTNHSSAMAFCVYSPLWNTISPAFTVEVGSSRERRHPLHYIVVSPYCRVSYRDDPPRD